MLHFYDEFKGFLFENKKNFVVREIFFGGGIV
jgi:hypothetical protein